MDSPQRLALSGLVILGGGTGQRLGGASKPDLVVRGRRALEWALTSEPGIPHVCVVPETVTVPRDVIRVMEEPPRSGPAAGFIAGVQALLKVLPEETPSRWIGLVPVDAPLATLTFPLLLEAVEESISQGRRIDGVLACAAGHRQNLIGVFSLDALRKGKSFDACAIGRTQHDRCRGPRIVGRRYRYAKRSCPRTAGR